ncbi:leucyl aminopeptidase [Weeksellaceae bacterium TAE3-ERU29]|nr:leucyl aminopeptidase [Weeksellaceae bacterium TAE3-ERU29]
MTKYTETLVLQKAEQESSVSLIIFNESCECKNKLPKVVLDTLENQKSNKVFTLFNDDKVVLAAYAVKTDNEKLRLLGAEVFKKIKELKLKEVSVSETKILDKSQLLALLEGIKLSSYQFTTYKEKKENNTDFVPTVNVVSEQASTEDLDKLNNICKAVSIAKNMINEPVNKLDALGYSAYAEELGKECGFDVEVLHKEKIQELKMGGLLGVNAGSKTPPTFNIFTYKPKNAVNEKPIVFVGKGVMYDTGGYSLKPSNYMSTMKCDMGGGAAVLGSIAAISMNKLPYYVIGLVPATDNKIGPDALVVDDVITMMSGKTVEVQNTDAEGRLVLADALHYAKRYNPELVIDLATLTGAAAAITGPFGIAMAGNTPKNMEQVKVAGKITHEQIFELPFWEEYDELLKSDIADLKNIGGKIGGATTAGKFLENFTDYNWIHLDIAGPAFLDSAKGYKQSGGTGAGVRLLHELVCQRINEK